MTSDEEEAAKVVVALRAIDHNEPVTYEHHDIPPRQGAHDFWINLSETREALEVTTFAEQETKTNSAHWQKRGLGYSTNIDSLKSAWHVMIDPAFNAATLKRNLGEWLQALENEGITATSHWNSRHIFDSPATRKLFASGVTSASTVSGVPPGCVSFSYITVLPTRPAGDPDHIPRALTAALALPRHKGDAVKLGRSGVPVRHLFLWVDVSSRWDVARAFNEGLPKTAPVVDEEITWVWLGRPTQDGAEVLRWSAPVGWRRDYATFS